MLWHEQSWPALEAMDKDTPVMIPLGACEQHGHHLPVLVDTIQVQALAERVEQQLGDKVLLLPPLWVGNSHHHKDFPGTISLPPSLYSRVIGQIAQSVLRAGFKRIFFLNGHGGNETPVSQALTELVGQCDQADDAYLVFASWWGVGEQAIKPEKHAMETEFVSHACEYETSLMLALRPDLVRQDLIQLDKPVLNSDWFNFEYGGKVNVFRRYHRLTTSGSMGSPDKATSQKGASMIEAVVADIVAFLKDFATWPPLPPRKKEDA